MRAAESLIGCLLRDSALYGRIATLVCEDDLPPNLRGLFAYVRDAKEKVDAITAMDSGFADAISLASAGFAPNHVETYAKEVARAGERRRVRDAGKRIALAEDYAEAQALLADVRPLQAAQLKTAEAGLGEMLAIMQARFNAESVVTGTPTGLASLDEITGGWQAGDLVGLGGSTSMGKTAFALQAAIAAGRCYYASLEMATAQLYERVLSNVGEIPYRHLRFPREAPDTFIQKDGPLYRAIAVASKLPLIVDDQPGLTVDQIAARARQLHMVEPLRLVVVDHLNLIRRPRKNTTEELGEVAMHLKNLAKELKIPVMVLVQLNRNSKAGDNKRPELEAFRSSGEIEEALDTAVFVYRDEYHNPNGPLKGYAEFIVRKQRQGERNVTAWAKSYLSQMRFESCDEPELATAGTNDNGGGFASRYGQTSQPRPMAVAGGTR